MAKRGGLQEQYAFLIAVYAVRQGSDVGAVIPDAMAIDIIESKTTAGNSEVYEKIAEWTDSRTAYIPLSLCIFLTVRASLPSGKLAIG